jgi:hypothetical protein
MFTSQTGNTVNDGDIVAGDKKTINYNINANASAILSLYVRLRSNEDQDSYISRIGHKLNHYCNVSTDGDVRGLEDKLTSSNRTDLIRIAARLKEDAAKIIMRLQTSPIAQDILTYLLSEIYSNFLLEVTPSIEKNESRSVVDALINDKVINPALQLLGENDLGITKEDVLGLLFFLGGNCHIRWDKC